MVGNWLRFFADAEAPERDNLNNICRRWDWIFIQMLVQKFPSHVCDENKNSHSTSFKVVDWEQKKKEISFCARWQLVVERNQSHKMQIQSGKIFVFNFYSIIFLESQLSVNDANDVLRLNLVEVSPKFCFEMRIKPKDLNFLRTKNFKLILNNILL